MYNQFPYSQFSPNPFNSFTKIPTTGEGLLGLAKKSFNWDTFLNNAQRTLNVINQAMPIYNQVRPMFRNMGTIFKVLGELNNTSPTTSTSNTPALTTTNTTVSSTPQFFA